MIHPLRFCLVLHNHQPVGNFDGVFEQAYRDSYLPFLDTFEPYSSLRISLHTSGPLMEWLDRHHPEYVDRLAGLVAAGRIEIVGGAYHEPILTMIPPRDRVGQIRDYTAWLESRLTADVRGMWVAERVWEQSLAADIATAGIRYTILDDFHFRNAGLSEEQLYGYYLTEDDGRVLSIFPGSERLRYLIPFASPGQTIEYLRGIAEQHPNSVLVFGDDGEKFGTWPETKKHVYENGWLRQFFDALLANRDWLSATTLSDAMESVAPLGKVYLPDASYREMTEWALPVEQQLQYDEIVHQLEHDPRWPRLRRFVRGGFWRNFKVKYAEANEMYARMMMVSRRLLQAEQEGASADELRWARQCLYRGQCNCGYWHGAFGGIYLPHLRNAVYNNLIAADNLLDRSLARTGPYVEAAAEDYNFDARQEIRLTNDKLHCLIAPASGGQLYELDVRAICHNLLATISRQPEAYHRKVRAGQQSQDSVASIHDRVVFKQAGLEQRLQYDFYQRKSLLDHFFDDQVDLAAIRSGVARQRGDFITGVYQSKIRRSSERVQAQLSRDGLAAGVPIRVTKAITIEAGSPTLEISYLLEDLPAGVPLHFGVEFNFAGLPSGADDRYFHEPGDPTTARRLGHLGSQLDLCDVQELGMVDLWLGIDVIWSANRPSSLWAFPIETVSQSEGGFELVHQSVVLLPHWQVQADPHGRWNVTMHIACDTTLAEQRMAPAEATR